MYAYMYPGMHSMHTALYVTFSIFLMFWKRATHGMLFLKKIRSLLFLTVQSGGKIRECSRLMFSKYNDQWYSLGLFPPLVLLLSEIGVSLIS